MNAQKARELTREHDSMIAQRQLSDIITQIRETCRKGEYFLLYYQDIKPKVKTKLTEMGYKVYPTIYDETISTKIEWSQSS